MNNEYITRKEAANIAGVSDQTISNWLSDGLILGNIINRISIVVNKESLINLLTNGKELSDCYKNIELLSAQKLKLESELKHQVDNLEQIKDCFNISKDEFKLIKSILYSIDFNEILNDREIEIKDHIISGKSISEIAEIYFLSKERVRQIFEKSLRRIAFRKKTTEFKSNLELKREIDYLKSTKNYTSYNRQNIISDFNEEEMKMRNLLLTKIDDLSLSTRAKNVINLDFRNIKTLGQLCELTESDIIKNRCCGKKTLNEIKEHVKALGLSLGMNLEKYRLYDQN